eukprot:jgi/Undpi1/4441/HiC_scaffold_17.g07795.m1
MKREGARGGVSMRRGGEREERGSRSAAGRLLRLGCSSGGGFHIYIGGCGGDGGGAGGFKLEATSADTVASRERGFKRYQTYHKDQADLKGPEGQRGPKDPRDPRDPKHHKHPRSTKGQTYLKEANQSKDPQDPKGPKDPTDPKDLEPDPPLVSTAVELPADSLWKDLLLERLQRKLRSPKRLARRAAAAAVTAAREIGVGEAVVGAEVVGEAEVGVGARIEVERVGVGVGGGEDTETMGEGLTEGSSGVVAGGVGGGGRPDAVTDRRKQRPGGGALEEEGVGVGVPRIPSGVNSGGVGDVGVGGEEEGLDQEERERGENRGRNKRLRAQPMTEASGGGGFFGCNSGGVLGQAAVVMEIPNGGDTAEGGRGKGSETDAGTGEGAAGTGGGGGEVGPPLKKRPPGGPFGASKARAWHAQQVVQSAVTPTQVCGNPGCGDNVD